MAGITLVQAETQLALWLEADAAVATSQSYTIGTRTLTRANAKYIQDRIIFWEARVQKLTRGGIKIMGATPCG